MNYLRDILQDPDVLSSPEAWQTRLLGLGFLTKAADTICCTIAGLVLFGKSPRRYLIRAGLRVMAFNDEDKAYQAALDDIIDGPMVGRWDIENGYKRLVDGGIIERFMDAMAPFISEEASQIDKGLRRDTQWF